MKKKKSVKVVIAIVIIALLSASSFYVLYSNGFSGFRKNPVPNENQIKIACVGDSITYGHGIKNWSRNNYPVKLGEILGNSYCVGNFGVNGSTAQSSGDKPYTEQKMYNESLNFDADIVVIMLGSNDSKSENWNYVENFKEQYSALVQTYIENDEDAKIILCSPAQPFYLNGETEGPAGFGINPSVVSEIRKVIEEIANENDCIFIDINSFTSENKQWFLADGIHPDAEGAERIAEYISRYIAI